MSTAFQEADPIVEFHDVSRWYGEVIGVNRVSATLRTGITGLLGPNGAGKSTLMNLITGLINPSEGEVRVMGRDPAIDRELMNTIGYCSQIDSFFETMTGLTFIESLLRVRGWGERHARTAAVQAMEQVRMAENMNRRIQSYSKGMRQRTKVALAIAHNPDILVLDEPLDGLDAVGRHEMIDLVRRFGREGRNVIISSHVLHEIETMTNNILLISGGYVLAEGDVREVRESLNRHPHRILLRCDRPREAALFLMGRPHTISVRVEELGDGLAVETRDLDAFYTDLNELVLERKSDVSLVTVADENISSIFEYLAGAGGRDRG